MNTPNTTLLEMSTKNVLITGCSSGGIGAAIALELATRGHRVYATARDVSKIPEKLSSLENVFVLPLDVTSSESVEDAAHKVQNIGGGLDILINNAGVGYTMPLMDVDIDQAQKLYETNVWGVLRTIQGFQDFLMMSQGKIVNIGSVGGVINTPWIGTYSSSKAALLNLSETLRVELAPLGVSVLTVMAGTVETHFHANEVEVVLPHSTFYTAAKEKISDWATGRAGPAGTPVEEFARVIADDAEKRQGVVWRGANSSIIYWVAKFAPTWLQDYLLGLDHGLEKLLELGQFMREKRESKQVKN